MDVQAVGIREGEVIVRVGRIASESLTAEVTRKERTPRGYTPKHLADKILTSRSALEETRMWSIPNV